MGRRRRKKWNPRYKHYARVHGRTPGAQMAHDYAAWPGGGMVDFMLWVQEQWRVFWSSAGYPEGEWSYRTLPRYQEAFDVYLSTLSVQEGSS